MKKIIPILILIITVMSFSSCQKSGINLFKGSYSFKTSGEVIVTAEVTNDSTNTLIPAVMYASVSNDIGQLNICDANKEKGDVVVVINYLNGDVVTTTGFCEGNTIELDEYRRDVLPVSITALLSGGFFIKVSATGTIYDDNTIVFEMRYDGKASIGSATFNIRDRNIQMVAYRN